MGSIVVASVISLNSFETSDSNICGADSEDKSMICKWPTLINSFYQQRDLKNYNRFITSSTYSSKGKVDICFKALFVSAASGSVFAGVAYMLKI